MNESPSRYGGVAAVMVLGVGMLLVGKTAVGIAILGVGVLAMAIMLAPSASGKALFASIGALICGAAIAYVAASNEITGTATYQPGTRGPSKIVTRQDSPAKFREVANFRWAMSGVSLVVGVAGIVFCGRFGDYLED
jgi:hypothetical protein